MKQYGFNKATEFSKKQISVIYAKAKSGDLKVEKWMMSKLYDLADFYGTDDNGSVEFEERFVLNILRSVFDGDLEDAQERINSTADIFFNNYTDKFQKTLDRTVFVA